MLFQYGEKEMNYLKRKDKKLGAVIDEYGFLERAVNPDLFTSLINSVVGQQISSKAADTVWKRFSEAAGQMTPRRIQQMDVAEVQACGMSMRKAEYIKGIAEAAANGELNLGQLSSMSDGDVVKALSGLRGVGVWTAEMLLIFSMQRPNVLSWGDLAIRRGIMKLYNLKELDKQRFERYKKRYAPYGSIASLYIWVVAEGQVYS